MAFCGQCGTQYEDGVKFCPSCGAPSAGQTPAAPAQVTMTDAQANKAMAVLAYFGPLVLIPIFGAKESPFARFHANQGLVLLIACVAYGIVYSILSGIFLAISFTLFSILGIVGTVCSIGISVLAIIGIINACKGQMKPLPLIGGIKILK